MRRVRFRKNTIFAIYLVSLLFLCVLGVVWVLSFQSRYHRKQVAELTQRLAEVESRLASVSSASSSVSSSASSSVDLAADRRFSRVDRLRDSERESLFWIEGHGFNKRYAYLDLSFKDGYRARYYFRPYPSKGEMVNLHRRITHDAIEHYWDPLLDYEI